MAAEHGASPEEKLLKLIENPKGPEPEKAAETAAPKKKKKGWFSFGKKPKAEGDAGKGTGLAFAFNLKWVNGLLFLSVLALGGYLVFDVMALDPGTRELFSQVSTTDPIYPILEDSVKKTARDLAFYRSGVDRRNPFIPPGQEPVEEKSRRPSILKKPKSNQMKNLLQSLQLVGVSSGKENIAMIEDSASGRTYFVKKGQVMNNMKVQTITHEKVVFTFEGEEAEIF